MDAPAPASAAPARRTGLSKNQRIGLGLVLTLVGLGLLAVLLPTAPRLAYLLPIAAVGILALWTGGILMGIGSRS